MNNQMYNMGENRLISCYVAAVNNQDFFLFQPKKLANSPIEAFFRGIVRE